MYKDHILGFRENDIRFLLNKINPYQISMEIPKYNDFGFVLHLQRMSIRPAGCSAWLALSSATQFFLKHEKAEQEKYTTSCWA